MDLLIGAWKLSVERVALNDSEIAQLYDSSAAWWDFAQRLTGMNKAYERLFRHLQRKGLLKKDRDLKSVLDLGIGTGLFSEALIRATETRFELSGVDLSPRMLEKSRAKLSQFGVQPNLLCRETSSLPFADATVDVVISAFYVGECQRTSRSLAGGSARCTVKSTARVSRCPASCARLSGPVPVSLPSVRSHPSKRSANSIRLGECSPFSANRPRPVLWHSLRSRKAVI